MSRIGKKPVPLPQGVTAAVSGQTVTAKGPKGELKFVVNDEVLVKFENNQIAVEPRDQSKSARSKWGMSRTQIVNILHGVKDGFEKKLEINGVGYRAAMQGKNLQLALGFSHEVVYQTPQGITISVRQADRDHGQRHRQAAGRPGGRGDPQVPRARALQGQGREVRRREDRPQRRQEEVRPDSARNERYGFQGFHPAPRRPRAPPAQEGRRRPAAPVGAPFVEAHLCADHRRRQGPHAGRRLDDRRRSEGRRSRPAPTAPPLRPSAS